MITAQSIYKYIFAMTIITLTLYVGDKFRKSLSNPNEEYDMIKNYLLNDSPLYGFNKPKIWIHTKFEYNSRVWKSFMSRSSTDLNQPYLHITIRSIIDRCGDDFHICLIDDATFSKLLPSWDIELHKVAEPMRTHLRELGMALLIYHYGGMTLPNSFLCIRDNMKTLFDEATYNGKPFVAESHNRTENTNRKSSSFIPSTYILGAREKENEVIGELIEFLKNRYRSRSHFTSSFDFIGDSQHWCLDAVNSDKMNLIGGDIIGIKTPGGDPIFLDDLMSEYYLNLSSNAVGIWIPEDELLDRSKYQWFAVLREEQIWETNVILAKYMKASVMDNVYKFYSEQQKEIKSVVAI